MEENHHKHEGASDHMNLPEQPMRTVLMIS
jgi:hypothetical protein